MTIRSTTNQAESLKRANPEDEKDIPSTAIAPPFGHAASSSLSTSPDIWNALHRPPARERNVRARIERQIQPLMQNQSPEPREAPNLDEWLSEFNQHLNQNGDEEWDVIPHPDAESKRQSQTSAAPFQRSSPMVDRFAPPLPNEYHMAEGPMFPRVAAHCAPDPFFALTAEFQAAFDYPTSPSDDAPDPTYFMSQADPTLNPFTFNQSYQQRGPSDHLFAPADGTEHFPPMPAMHHQDYPMHFPSSIRNQRQDMPALSTFRQLHQSRTLNSRLFPVADQLSPTASNSNQNANQDPARQGLGATRPTAAANPMQEEHDSIPGSFRPWINKPS